jgi:hypothetical protein
LGEFECVKNHTLPPSSINTKLIYAVAGKTNEKSMYWNAGIM